MKSILVKDLYFAYNYVDVISGLDFQLDDGQIAVITGENGSGKSTFLKVLLGELKQRSGSVEMLGRDNLNRTDYRDVGYVPQVQNFEKIAFPITCLEIVVLNLYRDFGFVKIAKKEQVEKAKSILIRMGLEEYINRPFNELSGGLQQRVIIARAMVNSPKILILDEPTAGVDKESKTMFLNLIKSINEEDKVSIIIVTHELDLVKSIVKPDYTYKMEEGRLQNA